MMILFSYLDNKNMCDTDVRVPGREIDLFLDSNGDLDCTLYFGIFLRFYSRGSCRCSSIKILKIKLLDLDIVSFYAV